MRENLINPSTRNTGRNQQGVSTKIALCNLQGVGVIIEEGMIILREADLLLIVKNDQEGEVEPLKVTDVIDPGPNIHTKDPVVLLLITVDRLVGKLLAQITLTRTSAMEDGLIHLLMHLPRCRRK